MGAKKNFVLDTNVILHDYKCIENFQENDIYLPIVVLEELDKFKNWLGRLFYGRNGADALYRFLLVICLVCMVLYLFVRHPIIWALQVVLLVLAVARLFSKNTIVRSRENQKYLSMRAKVVQFFKRQRNRIKYRKTKSYRKCPKCKCILCLPKKKGTHTVKCPKCGEHFDVKI